MMAANMSGGVSLMKAVPKADSKARAGSTVVMIAADLLIIAKCISITNDTACVQAMYEIQTSHVRDMYAQVVEWKEACEYMKASKSRVFLLKHTPEARFECTADSLVEVSSVRLPRVGAVAFSTGDAEKRDGVHGRCMHGQGKYSKVADNRPEVLLYHKHRELQS
jgi:hypothetical protein